jgi:WD40 repeat protein
MSLTPPTPPTPIEDWPTPTPVRTQPQDVFRPAADAWQLAFPSRTAGFNALAANVNENAGIAFDAADAADLSAATASEASAAAVGAANYKGEWSALTGALGIPASVSHNNSVWLLTESVADVTAVEPGVDPVWFALTGAVDLETQVTGTLPIANGGTGLSALGTAGQVLTVNSDATALEYVEAGGDLVVGDYLLTARDEEEVAENFLLADGAIYLQATYPALFDEIGLLSGADPFNKITNPDVVPTDSVRGVGWSSDDVYLAAMGSFTGRLMIYKRSGDTFTKLPDPASLPGSAGNKGAFSSDDVYLAFGINNTPFIHIYKRSGDTFTKLSDPATLPAGQGLEAAFSSNVTYLAVAHDLSPFITIYKRSGDTFTKLTNPATLPAGQGNGVAFSSDDTYMAVAHNSSPFITIYKRSGDTFTKLSNPANLPPAAGRGVAFSSDNVYLAVAHATSPFITIYKRSGDTFTKLTNPATLPLTTMKVCAFSPDVKYLAVGGFGSGGVGQMVIYEIGSGDTFTKITDVSPPPATDTNSVDALRFSPENTYLATGSEGAVHLNIYKLLNYDPATEFAVPLIEQTESGASKQLTFIKAED